jgi:hypothetical protein
VRIGTVRMTGLTGRVAFLGTLLGIVACQESLMAPGACPDYCPTAEIQILDTLIQGSVVRDSSFRGYAASHRAERFQVTSAATGFQSLAVMRFSPLSAEFIGTDASVLTVASVDSFSVSLTVQRRSMEDSSVALDLYRLPADIDTLSTYAELAPLFHDSVLLGTIAVPDSLTSGSLSAVLPGDAFPTLEEDSLRAAVGVRLRADSAAYAYLNARESLEGPKITRFVTVQVADSTESRTDARNPHFDGLLVPDPPPAAPEALAVGGVPSARALLFLEMPGAIVDSTDVVRATLILPLAVPVYGASGDTATFRVDPILADVGRKSPYLTANSEDPRGIVWVPVGTADTVYLDVTHLVRAWRGNHSHPRAALLQLVGEAESATEFRFWSSRNAGATPSIHLTYVPIQGEGS